MAVIPLFKHVPHSVTWNGPKPCITTVSKGRNTHSNAAIQPIAVQAHTYIKLMSQGQVQPREEDSSGWKM